MVPKMPPSARRPRLHSLPIFVRLHGRPVILIGEGGAADAKRRLLERAGARIVGEDVVAALAVIAVEDDAEAEKAAERFRERNVLVNVTDRPHLCDFTLPAIVDRDPLIVAIGTGGASAGLAKALRQRLEALLPGTLGALASELSAARDSIRTRYPDAAERRHALDSALEGGALDPFGDGGSVGDWLGSAQPVAPDRLATIVLGSPEPDDLTLRQARLLSRADRVYHSADVPTAILNRARADAARIVGDAPAEPGPGLSIALRMAR